MYQPVLGRQSNVSDFFFDLVSGLVKVIAVSALVPHILDALFCSAGRQPSSREIRRQPRRDRQCCWVMMYGE